jgi:hypothetical protein
MGSRKRARDEMEAEEPAPEPSLLHKIRNMWQFANLAQYIFLFGDAVKIDNELDIEVRHNAPKPSSDAPGTILVERLLNLSQELENECLKPQPSEKLAHVGLALLKHVSSHKGLTYAFHLNPTTVSY